MYPAEVARKVYVLCVCIVGEDNCFMDVGENNVQMHEEIMLSYEEAIHFWTGGENYV